MKAPTVDPAQLDANHASQTTVPHVLTDSPKIKLLLGLSAIQAAFQINSSIKYALTVLLTVFLASTKLYV